MNIEKIGAVLDRVVSDLEKSESAKDSMFRAALHIMRDRTMKALLAELEPPAARRWTPKRDKGRWILEDGRGRVLSQRRGRAQHLTPVYFINLAGAQQRAEKLNDADSYADQTRDQAPDRST